MSKFDLDLGDNSHESDVEENYIGDYVGERSLDGKRNGVGKAILPNRDQYEGDYWKGLRNGHGIYSFKNGARYDGEWKKGVKHGRGKFTYLDGSWYCGDFKHNMKNGFGKYVYENRDVYEGNWKNDAKHGVGTYKYKEIEIMIRATWVEGILKGPIEIFYPNFRYHGYWHKQHSVGQGAFSFGMKFMLPGHVDYYPNPEFTQNKDSKTFEIDLNEMEKSAGENEVSLVPKCLPQFVAHEIQPYDYSKLPQHPMPLPTADSSSTVCSQSFQSESEVQVFQIHSPVLIAANPVDAEDFENGDNTEVEPETQLFKNSDSIFSSS